jgi:hypothetical protein
MLFGSSATLRHPIPPGAGRGGAALLSGAMSVAGVAHGSQILRPIVPTVIDVVDLGGRADAHREPQLAEPTVAFQDMVAGVRPRSRQGLAS